MIICDKHQGRMTPMLFTFAFPGAEYWCPYCGRTSGIIGAGETVEESKLLITIKLADAKRALPYLRAVGRKVAVQTKYRGKWIKPDELPAAEKARDSDHINHWDEPQVFHLMLSRAWFDATEADRKPVEYRRMGTRLEGQILAMRPGDIVAYHRAYTRTICARRVTMIDIGPCPYEGWDGDYYRIHSERITP